MPPFQLISEFEPRGDQPQAIQELSEGLKRGEKFQTLLGVTGSGKTYTMAHVIQNIGKPVLLISHNKTLAAQLYGELSGFFPKNAVEYFISYYDYYQPEAYIPTTDTYIEFAEEYYRQEPIDWFYHALRSHPNYLRGKREETKRWPFSALSTEIPPRNQYGLDGI